MAAASQQLEQRYRKVLAQFDDLIQLASQHELHAVQAPRVSQWSVGKQLEHLLLSGETIVDRFDRLMDGREAPATGGPTLLGRLLLALGFFPRGYGKAPKAVVPAGRDPADIDAGLRRLKQRFEQFAEALPPLEESGWRCRHPILGSFDVNQWMRFFDLHHRHHLKIVRDIRRAAARGS